MRDDLPSQEEILEELSSKVALQIDRLAPVAFDSALREMTRYHRFLLALNASRTPDGAPVSYAEVPGDAWTGPHLDWIGQYRRLFERAANRIPDDDHFIRKLAYVARSLLPGPGDPELSPNVVGAIVNLGPILMVVDDPRRLAQDIASEFAHRRKQNSVHLCSSAITHMALEDAQGLSQSSEDLSDAIGSAMPQTPMQMFQLLLDLGFRSGVCRDAYA